MKKNGIIPLFHDGLYVDSRLVACLGALLPGVTCYLCIAYTYIFQSSHAKNFTTSDCPNLNSGIPPVSYSIETEPQKFLWLLVMFIHLPPRLLFPILYTRLFLLLLPEKSNARCFRILHIPYKCSMTIEAAALISVTIFEMKSKFVLHATAFVVWIVSFNCNMLFSTILHKTSGLQDLHEQLKQTYRIKLTLLIFSSTLSVSAAFSYFLYVSHCLQPAFVCFALAEYIMVGINTLFHFLVYWDYRKAAETISQNFDHIVPNQNEDVYTKKMISDYVSRNGNLH